MGGEEFDSGWWMEEDTAMGMREEEMCVHGVEVQEEAVHQQQHARCYVAGECTHCFSMHSNKHALVLDEQQWQERRATVENMLIAMKFE